MNRSRALFLLSLVFIAAIAGTWYMTAYAADTDDGEEINNGFVGPCGWRKGFRRMFGPQRFIEVSEEFEAKVLSLAENDLDVQGLLVEGYTISGVRPILKSVVDVNGDVTTKATSAIVILKNQDEKSFVTVWVDLNAGSVTKIVILTRTVIEKT